MIEKGNGNGNGKGKRGLIKTGHHILKTAVFGKNEWKVSLCNRCHSEYENYATVMEGIILRLFWYCYPALFILFIKKDGKPISRAEIVSLCLTEFFSIAFSTKKREILKSKLREQMMNNWIPEFEARAVIREELGQRYRLN